MELGDRFWSKVDADGDCWEWTASVNVRHGYGQFHWKGRPHRAHVLAWESLVGPVAEGHELDHRCRNRRCVNPDHLEPVTRRVNTLRSPTAPTAINARKTHCIRGHALRGTNLYVRPNGHRNCRSCRRANR